MCSEVWIYLDVATSVPPADVHGAVVAIVPAQSGESGSLYTAVLSLQDRYSAARTTAATRSHSSSVFLQSSSVFTLPCHGLPDQQPDGGDAGGGGVQGAGQRGPRLPQELVHHGLRAAEAQHPQAGLRYADKVNDGA